MALQNLPKDLPETYERALSKVHRRAGSGTLMARKVFKWIICAKRPLFMDELKEALGVKLGDQDLNLEDMPPDGSSIIRFCSNLVIFDKADRTVALAHHTVQEFLLRPPSNTACLNFCFNLRDANMEIAEICLTYLSFNAFERQIVRTEELVVPGMRARLVPGIMREVLAPKSFGSEFYNVWTGLSRIRTSIHRPDPILGRYGSNFRRKKPGFNNDHPGYRLLGYLVENWLFHTAHLSEGHPRWDMFRNFVFEKKLAFEFRPWDNYQLISDLPHQAMFHWAVNYGHIPLLQLLNSSEATRLQDYCLRKDQKGAFPLATAIKNGHVKCTQMLFKELFPLAEFLEEDHKKQIHVALSRVSREEAEVMTDIFIGHTNPTFFFPAEAGEASSKPLVEAIRQGHEVCARLLLKKHSPNDDIKALMAHDKLQGRSLIGWASALGNDPILKHLMHHADYSCERCIDSVDNERDSPLIAYLCYCQ